MEETTLLKQILTKIINTQSQIIGPDLAIARVLSTGMVKITGENLNEQSILLEGNSQEILQATFNAYREVFGQASVDVCIDVLNTFPENLLTSVLPQGITIKK